MADRQKAKDASDLMFFCQPECVSIHFHDTRGEHDPANDHEGESSHRPGNVGQCSGHAQQLEAD